jgi:hypothetical protein
MRVASETGGYCSPSMTTGGVMECSIDAMTGGGGVAAKPLVAARHMIKKTVFILNSVLPNARMDCTTLSTHGRRERQAVARIDIKSSMSSIIVKQSC